MAAYLNHTLVFALLSVLLFSCCESRARPRSLEDLDRLKVLDEIRDLSSVITLIDIPEDNTPKGPEDEDDSGSGTENTENAQCRGLFNNIQEVNASANGTKDAPDLIHANYDTLCDKTDSDKIKKLPVYIVGWELKEHCGEVNTIPFKRFRLDEYHAKKPRFDIPGMCIPMKGKEMTILMVDPDAPSKKSHRCRSWLHWLVVNIPRGNLAQGKEIITYKPPAPPLHSGAHRYFFLLYEQNHHIQDIDDSDNNMAERCGFNVRTFAEDNSLVGPIALNMFLTERKRMKQDDDEENSKDKEKKEKEKEDKDKKEKKDKEDKEKEEQKGKGNQKKAETDNSKEEQKKAGDEKKVEQNDNVDAKNKEQQNSGEQTKAKEKQDTKDNEKSESKVRNDNKQKEGEQKKNVTSSKEEQANKDAQNKKEGENNKGAQRDKIDATTSEEQKNIPVTKETQEQKNKEVKLGTVDAKNNQIQNNNVQQKNETKTQGTQEQKINEVLTAKMDGNNNGNQVNKVDQNNKTTKK